MKFRADFVTNSSSSSFVTVRIYSDVSTVQYEAPDIYWEDGSIEKMLRKLCKCKTMDAIIKTLKIAPNSVHWYSGEENIAMEDLTKVRIASGYIMYGQEISEAISDGEIDENSVWDENGRVLEGQAFVLNTRTKEIQPDKIDADDGYGI